MWNTVKAITSSFSSMAMGAPTLFEPQSLQPGNVPQFGKQATEEKRQLYELLIDKTMIVSDGIWLGTAVNLTKEFESGELGARQGEIQHDHLILWGESDWLISQDDMREMAQELPNSELRVLPGVGHSCNLEDPD